MSNRFFAFGCSFTHYIWPTWADIVGKEFTYYQNWGRSGGGNQYIANSITECHLKNQFGPGDTVGIMWTNIAREDRYVNNKWLSPGNIYTQNVYPASFIKNFSDNRGYFIRDLASIYLIDQLLKTTGCKYYFFSMVPILNIDQYNNSDINACVSDIVPYYKKIIDTIRPSVYEVVFNNDWWSRPFLPNLKLTLVEDNYNECAGPEWPSFNDFMERKFTNIKSYILDEIFDNSKWDWSEKIKKSNRIDPHPTPLEHLEYVDKIFPEITISASTKEWVSAEEVKVQNKQSSGNISQKINRW